MVSTKSKLSAAVLGLVLAGDPASVILDKFLDEKEGSSLTAYRDGSGIWTICRGVIRIDGKPIVQGMRLMQPAPDLLTPLNGIISPSESESKPPRTR